MHTSSEALSADMSGFLPAPAASASLAARPLDMAAPQAPHPERLGRWCVEHLRHQRSWALIVEPHRKIAELIAYLLDFELGIQAVSLPGPRLIPSLFQRWVPDLVLAEVPTIQGAPSAEDLESLRPVLEAAQSHQRLPLPVILCTTYREVTPAMAHSAGFVGLIYKPFLPSTLVATVRGVLEGASDTIH